MTRHGWTLVYEEKRDGIPTGAHRFFKDKDGRVAVADRSGYWPETCEDGILWLDLKRAIKVEVNRSGRSHAHIPLLVDRDKDRPSWTGESPVAGLEIAALFGLEVVFSDETRRFLDAHATWREKRKEAPYDTCKNCGAGSEPDEGRCWKCDEVRR